MVRFPRVVSVGAVVLLLAFGAAAQQTVFWVDPILGDDVNDGTDQHPFRTLARAADVTENVGYACTIILVNSGVHGVNSYVTIASDVNLRGESPSVHSTVRITSDQVQPARVRKLAGGSVSYIDFVVDAYDFSEGLVLTAGQSFTSVDACAIDGLGAGNVVGISVYGGTQQTVVIRDCIISNVQTGLYAENSGVGVTRCRFSNIAGDAVRVVFRIYKQSGVDVPLLGDADDIENTGLNQFRNVTGFCLNNTTGTSVQAEINDWGVYSEEEIAQKVQGSAETNQFLGKGIAPGSVVVDLVDQASGAAISQTASPSCTIPALGMTAELDTSLKFIFGAVTEGQWSIQGSATGYATTSVAVNVSSSTVNAAQIALGAGTSTVGNPTSTVASTSCGAKNGMAAYACCTLILCGEGARRRRRK